MRYQVGVLLATVMSLVGLSSCSMFRSAIAPPPQPLPTQIPIQTNNVIGLFFVKKDNTTGNYRGELLPIAVRLNGQYVDASQDITLDSRNPVLLDNLVQNYADRSVLKAVSEFTLINQAQAVGRFKVAQFGATPLACSAFVVGQGTVQAATLSDLYKTLPETRTNTYQGKLGDRSFDESSRWLFAAHQYTLTPVRLTTHRDEAQYKQDLLAAANPLFAAAKESQTVTGATVVERVQVFDLDHDGEPEVLGMVRKGSEPESVPPTARGRSQTTAYMNLWLTYKTEQPTVLAHEVVAWQIPVSRRPYEVLEVLDLDQDGRDEVIVRNLGYESYSFGIHTLQDGTLKPVFTGTNYGC